MPVLNQIEISLDPEKIAHDLNRGRENKGIVEGLAKALEAAAGRGALNLDPVSPEAIFRGQGLPAYRRDWAAYTAAWTKLGHDPPDFGIEARWHPPAERLALRPYRKQLRWARSFAAAETPDEALRAAERRLRLNDVTGTLSRYTSLRRIGRALWRRLRRGTRKVEH